MITIPLIFLLLALSNVTGIKPPTDIPRNQMVVIHKLSQNPADYGLTTLNGSKVEGFVCLGYGYSICDTQPLNTIHLEVDVWKQPRRMQHNAMHEYGHIKFGESEQKAENYACETVPYYIVTHGIMCKP